MKITIIAGARPNFMKIAPIIHAIQSARESGKDIHFRLVHTGQHYDKKMSDDFFRQLDIPEPHINLEAGGGSQAEQTAAIMVRFEKELLDNPADMVLVVGDVTSTMACAITAKKLQTKVAHVEAGIRSNDLMMPEEINRLITDSITDYFFTTTKEAGDNLLRSGVTEDRIFLVGNTMIDTLKEQEPKFLKPTFWDTYNLQRSNYLVLTLHRPSNVDHKEQLTALVKVIEENVHGLPVIFPVHPRTKERLDRFGINTSNIKLVDPMSYLEFNFLVKHAKGVVTDSGGITEETTVMGVPCMTLRTTTERPETCTIGTNELIGLDPEALKEGMIKLFEGGWKKGGIPPFWDGKTADRIVNALLKFC